MKNTQQTVGLTPRQLQRLNTTKKRLEQLQNEIGTILTSTSAVIPQKKNENLTASGRPRNELPLRDVILKVTSRSPKTLMEILEGVKKEGYKFKAARETHCVGAYLYGKQGKKVFTQTKDGTHRFFPKNKKK